MGERWREKIERFTGFFSTFNEALVLVGLISLGAVGNRALKGKLLEDRLNIFLWASLALSGVVSILFSPHKATAVPCFFIPFVFIYLYILGRYAISDPEGFMRSSIRGATVLSLIAVVAKIFQLQWSIGSFRILARFSAGERGEILYVADNLLGLMIQVGVVGAMGSLLAHWREKKYRLEDIVSFLLCTGGLFVSASRGAIMGSSVGLLFLAFHYGPFAILVAAVVLSGSLLMAAVVRKTGNFLDIFQDPVRLIIWRTSLKVISARPLFGWGPGVFRPAFERYRPAGFTTDVTCAHSDYLNIFIGWGLVGGLIFWGWQFFIIVKSWLKGLNPLQRTIAAVLIAFYVHVGVNDLFAAYAGLFLGLLQHHSFLEEKKEFRGIVSRRGGEKPLNAR